MRRRAGSLRGLPANSARARKIAEDHRWKLSLLRAFVGKHSWSELRADTIVPPGVRLFSWVQGRRQAYRSDEIAAWLVAECESIPGWSWAPIRDRQQRNIDNLRVFVGQHGWDQLTVEARVGGVLLSGWCAMRRVEYGRGDLADRIIRALEAIPGWSWDPRESGYRRNLLALRGHVARHGWDGLNLDTTARNGIRIGKWANHIRTLRRQHKLVPLARRTPPRS